MYFLLLFLHSLQTFSTIACRKTSFTRETCSLFYNLPPVNVARLATVCAAVDTFLAAFIGRVGRPEEDPVTEELTRKWRVGKPPERELKDAVQSPLSSFYSELFCLPVFHEAIGWERSVGVAGRFLTGPYSEMLCSLTITTFQMAKWKVVVFLRLLL